MEKIKNEKNGKSLRKKEGGKENYGIYIIMGQKACFWGKTPGKKSLGVGCE